MNIGKITYSSNTDLMNPRDPYQCQERSFSPNEKQMETEEHQEEITNHEYYSNR